MPEPLWDNGPVLYSAPGVFPMGTDSVILADFAHPGKRDRITDLGTGSGILSILAAFEGPDRLVSAVELDPDACALAAENFAANRLSGRITLYQRDLRDFRSFLPAGGADLVLSNPPYFAADSGPGATVRPANARGDATCSAAELCGAAAWSCRWGGRFCLCFRPERLCDLFCCLRESGLEPKRIRPVRHDAAHGIYLFLLEARRGGKPGLSWEPDLILRSPDGSETPELRRIYRRQPSGSDAPL